MTEKFRSLQIFRNDVPFVLNTLGLDDLKEYIQGLLEGENPKLSLNDGEPITIRYKKSQDDKSVHCINGIAYNNGTNTTILWDELNITTQPQDPSENNFVTLLHTKNSDGTITFTVSNTLGDFNTVNGLATTDAVKTYVTEQIGKIPTVPEYTIKPLETANEGYLKSYQLFKGADAVENAVIDIPKDYLVKEASIKTVETENVPEVGYKVGDKYFDFVINTKDDTTEDQHLYINAKDLVDTYVAGNGINIADDNTITVKIKEDEQYITVDENGIHTTDALQSAIEDSTKTAISNLGTAKAEEGKVITSIGVNDEGKLVIEETELPEGEVYYGGHDIKVSTEMRGEDTETKNYIDTSLDAAIESCVTIGNLNNGETLTAGMTLSQILEKILVKEFQPKKTSPSTKLIINPTLKNTYEVGETLGTLNLTHEYTDGYYSADGTNYKTNKFNDLHNVSDNKLPANCTEGDTIYKLNDSTISSTYNGTEKLTERKFTFKCQTSYGASDVTPMTNLGKDATITITSGTATSNEITINAYYKAYSVIISNNEIPANISDLMTDSNGYFITSDTVKKTDTYNIQGGESMFLFLPQSKTFTINNSLGSPAQSEFVKKQEVTNTLETVYNVYQKRNDSGNVAGYKELTFANVQ